MTVYLDFDDYDEFAAAEREHRRERLRPDQLACDLANAWDQARRMAAEIGEYAFEDDRIVQELTRHGLVGADTARLMRLAASRTAPSGML